MSHHINFTFVKIIINFTFIKIVINFTFIKIVIKGVSRFQKTNQIWSRAQVQNNNFLKIHTLYVQLEVLLH